MNVKIKALLAMALLSCNGVHAMMVPLALGGGNTSALVYLEQRASEDIMGIYRSLDPLPRDCSVFEIDALHKNALITSTTKGVVDAFAREYVENMEGQQRTINRQIQQLRSLSQRMQDAIEQNTHESLNQPWNESPDEESAQGPGEAIILLLRDDGHDLDVQRERLERFIENLNTQVASIGNKIGRITDQKGQVTTHLQRSGLEMCLNTQILIRQAHSKVAEFEQIRKAQKKSDMRVRELESVLLERETAFDQTKKANESLIRKNRALKEQIRTLQNQLKTLREQLEELQALVARDGAGKEVDDATQTLLKKQTDEIARLVAIVQTKDMQIATLRTELKDIQDIRAKQDGTIAGLRSYLPAHRAKK